MRPRQRRPALHVLVARRVECRRVGVPVARPPHRLRPAVPVEHLVECRRVAVLAEHPVERPVAGLVARLLGWVDVPVGQPVEYPVAVVPEHLLEWVAVLAELQVVALQVVELRVEDVPAELPAECTLRRQLLIRWRLQPRRSKPAQLPKIKASATSPSCSPLCFDSNFPALFNHLRLPTPHFPIPTAL